MNRVLCLVVFVAIQSHAQVTTDVYIQFFGEVISTKDSSKVAGVSVQYEKLPYYDDMGIGTSKADGKFEFYLIKGLKYNFSFKKEGFIPLQKEIEIGDEGSGTQKVAFYMEAEAEAEVDHFTLENLIFARGSADIAASSYTGLDELAAWINARPTVIIQLEGHTDFDGNAEANMLLSQARVESVKTYLISKGVNKNKVLTKAFGGTQPLSTDRTDEAKERNRRVEVTVISK